MKTRLFLGLLFSALAIGMSATASNAGPVSTAFSPALFETSAVVKIQYGCGWRYSCSGGYGAPQVNIYGPVNVYTNGGWRPYYNSGWSSNYGDNWRWRGGYGNGQGGIGCGGYPCDENCGVMCWYRRIRAGYCGHGCNVYRERVSFYGNGNSFTPYVNSTNGGVSQFNYENTEYNGASGAGYSQYSQGGSNASYGGAAGYSQYDAQNGGYAPQDRAPRERLADRLRRYFSVRSDRQERRDSSSVRFERPINGEAVPLRRFQWPQISAGVYGQKLLSKISGFPNVASPHPAPFPLGEGRRFNGCGEPNRWSVWRTR